jgi:predicted RNA binding protein YcfA (HicA-like mRNA interferase family)
VTGPFSSTEVYDVLTDHGFRHVDTTGSHAKLRREDPNTGEVRVVTVPMGKEAVHPDTLRSIMEQAGGDDFQRFKRWLDDCR